jgi:hypothetical protein
MSAIISLLCNTFKTLKTCYFVVLLSIFNGERNAVKALRLFKTNNKALIKPLIIVNSRLHSYIGIYSQIGNYSLYYNYQYKSLLSH